MNPVDLSGAVPFRGDIKPPPQPPRRRASGAGFLSLFKSADSAEDEEVPAGLDVALLEEQIDRIHELGQSLAKLQTLEQVRAYKTAVRALVDHFVRNGLEASEVVSNRTVLNQKKYTLVKVIDEKLERLVTGILQSQAKQLDILARLEEIQGLLVDLIH